MDKKILIDNLIRVLNSELQAAVKSATTTAQGATHEETKSEGSKDTRATEASYLARGQAKRAEELRETINRISVMTLNNFDDDTPISSSAVLTLEDENENEKHYFLITHGGGYELSVDDKTFMTITTKSPIGKALLEKYLDDEITLVTPKSKQIMTVKELY